MGYLGIDGTLCSHVRRGMLQLTGRGIQTDYRRKTGLLHGCRVVLVKVLSLLKTQ
jgi:hypothetical protein